MQYGCTSCKRLTEDDGWPEAGPRLRGRLPKGNGIRLPNGSKRPPMPELAARGLTAPTKRRGTRPGPWPSRRASTTGPTRGKRRTRGRRARNGSPDTSRAHARATGRAAPTPAGRDANARRAPAPANAATSRRQPTIPATSPNVRTRQRPPPRQAAGSSLCRDSTSSQPAATAQRTNRRRRSAEQKPIARTARRRDCSIGCPPHSRAAADCLNASHYDRTGGRTLSPLSDCRQSLIRGNHESRRRMRSLRATFRRARSEKTDGSPQT